MTVNLTMVMTTLLKNLVQFAFLSIIEIQQVGQMVENSFGRGLLPVHLLNPVIPTRPQLGLDPHELHKGSKNRSQRERRQYPKDRLTPVFQGVNPPPLCLQEHSTQIPEKRRVAGTAQKGVLKNRLQTPHLAVGRARDRWPVSER